MARPWTAGRSRSRCRLAPAQVAAEAAGRREPTMQVAAVSIPGLPGMETAATCMVGSRLPAASAATCAGASRHLDLERPAVHGLAIELLDRVGGLLGRRHLDEAESARATRVTIHHDGGGFDAAGHREHLAQPIVRRGEGQAADIKFMRHGENLQRELPPGNGTLWEAEDGTRVEVW